MKDLTEESFLLAFRRFAARKFLPRTMISNHGSTYLAAFETIEKLLKSSTIVNELAKDGTTWQFIQKRAPWYGEFGRGWLVLLNPAYVKHSEDHSYR